MSTFLRWYSTFTIGLRQDHHSDGLAEFYDRHHGDDGSTQGFSRLYELN